jgi:hypothetical protein
MGLSAEASDDFCSGAVNPNWKKENIFEKTIVSKGS